MSNKAKLFTFISRSAPYGSCRPQLCLDAALATAVFEQQVHYLFVDDGVFQLLNNQQGDAIGSKTLGSAMETLELYGIEKVLVDSNSLDQRGLEDEDLLLPVERVSDEDIRSLIAKSDYVFNL
jgi:tRNA 2-thiouridine synthesizing protein C